MWVLHLFIYFSPLNNVGFAFFFFHSIFFFSWFWLLKLCLAYRWVCGQGKKNLPPVRGTARPAEKKKTILHGTTRQANRANTARHKAQHELHGTISTPTSLFMKINQETMKNKCTTMILKIQYL